MRKQYLTPSIKIIVLNSNDLIATSPRLNGNFSDPSQSNLGRGRNDFDDWDDDF